MVSNDIKEYVKQRNIQMVRKELLAILNANPDMGDGSFIENLKYAQKELSNSELFDSYSGGFNMQDDKSLWNTSYVAKIFLQLRREFSKEIIEHLIAVAPVAYCEKVAQRDLQKQTSTKARDLPKEENYPASSLRGICVKIVKWLLIILAIVVVITLAIKLI